MKRIPIKVECRSGYKADEYPVCFYWANIKFEIAEISDRWYQVFEIKDSPVADYFKVRTAEATEFIIKHELKDDQWFLVTADEPIFRISAN